MKESINVSESEQKMECCECGHIHTRGERAEKQIGDWTCHYCPNCWEESYYKLDN